MKKTNTHDLVLAALCAALTAVVAPFSIAIGPISLTLSVFAVLFTGAMLRPGWAFAAQVVYIAIGAIGRRFSPASSPARRFCWAPPAAIWWLIP